MPTLLRVSGASSANTAQTISLSSGDDQTAGALFGKQLQLVRLTATYSSSVTSTSITVNLNSGLGANYDATIKTDTLTGTSWVWHVADDITDLIAMPYQSATVTSDAFDFVLAAGGAGITSYGAIYFKAVE